MGEILRVLIIDDSEQDFLLLQRALRKGRGEIEAVRVDTAAAMKQAMDDAKWDVAISDCFMPYFSAEGALKVWKEKGEDRPFIVASGAIGEEQAVALLKAGAHDFVHKGNLARLVPAIERELRETRVRYARREAEEALRQSEKHRFSLQAELGCAAEIQKKLLPEKPPAIPGFDIAARCLPALEVGGDFYDWHENLSGILTLTLGDVMGKGMAAAMLMATVRAAVRAGAQDNPPADALALTEKALRQDLESSESFVTLFHGCLNANTRYMKFVDCGHGFLFLRRADGSVEELLPRGVPLGVSAQDAYQEGEFRFHPGDALVLYTDGLVDAVSEQPLENRLLAARLEGAPTAEAMVGRLAEVVPPETLRPDDLTVLVVLCLK